MTFIGNYAFTCKLGTLLRYKEQHWLRGMERGNHQVTDYIVTDGQRKAWADCFQTLVACANELPKEFRELDVVFEYVLPNHSPESKKAAEDQGIRADVLLISDKTVMVLEFKRRDDVFIGHVRQARKYRTRIQKYHCQSVGMSKKTILVLTDGEQISEQHPKVSVRSADLLAAEIRRLFETAPQPNKNIDQWLHSAFAVRTGEKA